MQLYADHGVRFLFPEDWSLEEERHDDCIGVTVSGPGTSVWSVALYPGRPRPEELILQAVDAFRQEYDDLDDYAVETRLAGVPNVSRDVEFFCLDLVSTACLRAFRTEDFTAFVLYQGTDQDLEETRDALEGISASLACDPPDDASDTPALG